MQEYTINFIIWFYAYKLKDLGLYVFGRFVLMMSLTRAWPMLSNIKRPLFGDSSFIGRIVGFGIRFWWGLFGSILSILYVIPFIVIWALVAVVPLVPIYTLVQYLS